MANHNESQYLVTRDDDVKRDLDLIKAARRSRVRVVFVRQFLRRLSRKKKCEDLVPSRFHLITLSARYSTDCAMANRRCLLHTGAR
jgi:hypothetical protein